MFVRAVFASAIVLAAFGASQGPALAVHSAVCSTSNASPGQLITVSGSGATPGGQMRLIFNGITVNQSPADGFGNYSLSFNVPAGQAPGDYLVAVRDLNAMVPHTQAACTLRISGALVTPTPVPTPVPTAAPADDDDDDGGDGGGLRQEQNQEQNINFPVAFPIPHFVGGSGGGGRSLPKTGADIAEVGGIGTATLVAGVTLVEFARRRRRHWLAPTESTAPTVSAAPTIPSVVPVLARAGETEGDLLLPYAATSSPPQESIDFIAPSF